MSRRTRTIAIAALLLAATLLVVGAGLYPDRSGRIVIIYGGLSSPHLIQLDLIGRIFGPLGLSWGMIEIIYLTPPT